MRGNVGTARLAAVLQTMAQRTAAALDNDWLSLGTLQADGSLLLDDYRHPFELGEYLVLDTLDHEVDTLDRVNAVLTTDTTPLTTLPGGGDSHTHGIASHNHPTIPPLSPELDERGRLVGAGDRVLCAWVNSGHNSPSSVVNPRPVDVVVIGRVYWSA
jgi:hypothetical protein